MVTPGLIVYVGIFRHSIFFDMTVSWEKIMAGDFGENLMENQR